MIGNTQGFVSSWNMLIKIVSIIDDFVSPILTISLLYPVLLSAGRLVSEQLYLLCSNPFDRYHISSVCSVESDFDDWSMLIFDL